MSAPRVRESSPDAPPIAPLLDYCCNLATANFLFFSIALNSKKVAPALPSDVTPTHALVRGRSLRRTSWILLLIITLQSVAFAIAPAGAEHAQDYEATSIASNTRDCVNGKPTGETPVHDDTCWRCCLACSFSTSGDGSDVGAVDASRVAFPPLAGPKALGGIPTKELPPRAFEFTRSWSSRAPPSFS
jgi:hypothetical protein